VVAEPKRGLQQRSAGSYVDLDTSDMFAQVDYDSLSGIVVWIEPLEDASARSTAPPAPAAAATTIRLEEPVRSGQPPWQGVIVGATIVFENRTPRAQSLYSLSEGNEFDLGAI